MTVAMQGRFYQYKDNKGTNWPLYGNMQVLAEEGIFFKPDMAWYNVL